MEKDYILAVLEANGGNQARTAEQLGIGSATLYRKLKRYGQVRSRWPRLGAGARIRPARCRGEW